MTATVTPISRQFAIGQEIRRVREFRGLDQQDLADFIGKSDAYISRIERGHRPASKGDLRNFADLLGVTVEELENPALSPSFVLADDGTDGPDPDRATVSGDSPRPANPHGDTTYDDVVPIDTGRRRLAEVVELPGITAETDAA